MLRNMKKIALILLIIFVSLGMISCSGDKKTAEEPKEAAKQTEAPAQESKTDSITVNLGDNTGSASIPKGYPSDLFPIYEGSFIASAMETGGSYTIIAFSKKDFKEVAAYYKEILKKANVTTESNVENGFTSFGKIGSYTYNFDVGESSEQEGYVTSITIILMP